MQTICSTWVVCYPQKIGQYRIWTAGIHYHLPVSSLKPRECKIKNPLRKKTSFIIRQRNPVPGFYPSIQTSVLHLLLQTEPNREGNF